jgi:hypothetical protein
MAYTFSCKFRCAVRAHLVVRFIQPDPSSGTGFLSKQPVLEARHSITILVTQRSGVTMAFSRSNLVTTRTSIFAPQFPLVHKSELRHSKASCKIKIDQDVYISRSLPKILQARRDDEYKLIAGI